MFPFGPICDDFQDPCVIHLLNVKHKITRHGPGRVFDKLASPFPACINYAFVLFLYFLLLKISNDEQNGKIQHRKMIHHSSLTLFNSRVNKVGPFFD